MSANYTIYKADYNPIPSHLDVDPLRDNFDQGNPTFDRYEQLTANGKFERIVHRSLEHLYYRDFYTNNKASFGSGHIKKQERYLGDKAYVISMPQSKFGEAILPGSVKIKLDYSFIQYIPYIGENLTGYNNYVLKQGTWTVVDDMFGNLYISGSYTNPEGYFYETPLGPVGNLEYTSSISKDRPLVGHWPFDSIYKFINIGPINYTSSYDKGLWPLRSYYNRVSVVDVNELLANQTGSNLSYPYNYNYYSPYPSFDNYIGIGMYFNKSVSSSIELKADTSHDHNQKYNFENGEFTLFMNFFIDDKTYPAGEDPVIPSCVLIAKEGPEDDIRVDKDGNIHRNNASTKVPWKIVIEGGVVKFKCQTSKDNVITVTGAPPYYGYNSVIITKEYVPNYDGSSAWRFSMRQSLRDGDINSTNNHSELVMVSNRNSLNCSNKANIFIGNSYKGNEGFTGMIGTVKMFKGCLTNYELILLNNSYGAGSTRVGNVFYNHGMMTLTATPMQWTDIASVECRGTHTIWENEVSCTVSPGEFGMSSNPTLEEYNPETDQYEYRPFVTGSAFKPFITTIGLYDNLGRLLVIGKLSTPIQTPDNTDTTFIVRYDR